MKARQTTGLWMASAVLACMGNGAIILAQEPAPLLQGPSVVEQDVREEAPAPGPGPIHEAIEAPALRTAAAERLDRSPPPPIFERPGTARPAPTAQWVPGYWEWDPARGDFLWVTGVWRVPPPGRSWVNGSWQRDENGWYRVPGSWGERRTTSPGATGAVVATGLEGSVPPEPAPNAAADPSTNGYDPTRDGPPSQHPEERIGPAPSPTSFYVPGHYEPRGRTVVWRPGYWARSQPGWNWIPAQWVRRPEGWAFQPGFWSRTPAARGPFAPIGPVNADRNPAPNLVESSPTTVAPGTPSLGSELQPLDPNNPAVNPGQPAGGDPRGLTATRDYQAARPAFDPQGGNPNNRLYDPYYLQNAGMGPSPDPNAFPGRDSLTGLPDGDPAYLSGDPYAPRPGQAGTRRSNSGTSSSTEVDQAQEARDRSIRRPPYGYAYDAYGRLYPVDPYGRPLVPRYYYGGPGRNAANRAAVFVNRLLNGF